MRTLLFILLLFTAHFAFSQQETKQKKKGSFWKALGEAITVDGEPIACSGLSANTRDIRGEWREYGAGGSAGSFSPRNHAYTFEPALDTYFDINVESERIPISLTVTDPSGRIIRGKRESVGIQYLNLQANLRGAYTIWVSPEEHNTRGNYRLSVIGYFAKSPEMTKSEFQKQTSEFRQNSSVHKYSIAADQGNLEFMYRSTGNNAAIEIQDAYGQTLRPHFSDTPTGRLQNQTVKIAAKSSVILTIANQNPGSEGTYELLLWGNFSVVEKEEIPAKGTSILPAIPTASATKPPTSRFLRTGQILYSIIYRIRLATAAHA